MLLNVLLTGTLMVSQTQPEVIKHININPYEIPLNVVGNIMVEFDIDTNGGIAGIKVVNTPDKELIPIVHKAVEKMKFSPALQGGIPVKVRYKLPILIK